MISDYKDMTPVQMRHLIREGKFTEPTSGLCPGYAQANLIVLPKEHAYDFLLFAQLRPGQKVQFEKTTVKEAQRLIREWDKAWKEHCRMLEEYAPGKPGVLGLRARASEDGGRKRHGWKRSGWKHNGWKR